MSGYGYQGSTKSGVTVTIYPSLGNGGYGDAVVLSGTHITSAYPAVVGVHVQNALAQGASFSVSLKRAGYLDPLDAFPVDSWVDISFTQNGLSWHTVRGLIDEVRAAASIGGDGATSETYSVIGRSFQKIYDDMPANFDAFLGDVEVDKQVLYALNSFVGAPDVICKAVLVDILKSLGRRNRGLWAMPTNMPGIGSANAGVYNKAIGPQALFVDVAKFVTTGFDLYALPRSIPARNILTGGGALWSLAQQYSDSSMCELFTELLPKSSTLQATGVIDTDGTVGLKESDSIMATILRDRPYIAVDPQIGFGPLRDKSPYFDIPQFVISKQKLVALDVGRSSYERINAFWLGNPDPASKAGNFPTYKRPLWDVQDQIAHGLRKMIIPLNYNFFHDVAVGVPTGQFRTIDECTTAVKRLFRDWYCPNALFLSGSVTLARGAPWVKVGCRLQIQDERDIDEPLNGYIEQVAHQWSLNSGTKTTVGFTRGFYGSERDMVAKVSDLSARYVEPQLLTGAVSNQ